MKTVFLKITSVFLWCWFLISSVLLTPILALLWLLTSWFDKNLRILHLFSCFWGAQYIWVNPFWKLKITGRENLKKGKTYLMVSNHQSLVDIIVIYSIFRHFRWTSKAENFKLPFVGWVLAANRSIRIYRASPKAFQLFHDQAVNALKSGNSLMVFPEGTRSPDGEMGNFKDGSFHIAQEMGVDILPMVLDGSSKAIPKKGWSLTGKQNIRLKILPSVSSSDENIAYKELRRKVYTIISDELNRMRKEDS